MKYLLKVLTCWEPVYKQCGVGGFFPCAYVDISVAIIFRATVLYSTVNYMLADFCIIANQTFTFTIPDAKTIVKYYSIFKWKYISEGSFLHPDL